MGTVHLLVDDRKGLEKLLPDACVAQNQSGHRRDERRRAAAGARGCGQRC